MVLMFQNWELPVVCCTVRLKTSIGSYIPDHRFAYYIYKQCLSMICALESPQGFSLSAHTPNYEKFSGVHYQQLASPDLESIWINLIPKELSPLYPRRDNTNLTHDLYTQYLVFVLVYALMHLCTISAKGPAKSNIN